MEEPGSFPHVDRRLLQNPQHIEKIKQRFANIDYDFNLYFVNQKGVDYVINDLSDQFTPQWDKDLAQLAGMTTSETIAKVTGLTVTPDPQAITVLYLSNANVDQTVSMTPWIVAHRFGHALTDRYSSLSPAIKSAMERLPHPQSTVASFMAPSERRSKDIFIPLKHVLTMRSARTKVLDGDVIEELLAQFLLQGRILFKLPDWFHIPAQAAMLTVQLKQKARQIEEIMRDLLDACVGQMFIAI